MNGKELPLMSLSKTDIKILQQLQQAARITNQHLADEIGLSTSPIWRKVCKLEEDAVIQGYRAVINRKKIGLNVIVFVRVTIDSHSEAVARTATASADFAMSVIRRLPRIKEMQSMFVLK